MISALFDDRNPERKALTESFFNEIHNYEVYISELTMVEIDRTPDPELRQKMNKTIAGYRTLAPTDEIEGLAKKYVENDAVPPSYPEDAYHIAIAVWNEMDYLLSWNFRHITRNKTRDIVRMVNTTNRLRSIEIISPAELL